MLCILFTMCDFLVLLISAINLFLCRITGPTIGVRTTIAKIAIVGFVNSQPNLVRKYIYTPLGGKQIIDW